MSRNNSTIPSQYNNSECGFTLIEGMLAALVVTFGLITLSGMQAITLSFNMDANETTRATNLAADMMERIQFNRRNVDNYAGMDTSAVCTLSLPAMALGDCNQWKNLLSSTYATGLGGVRGTVAVGAVGAGGTPPLLNQRTVQVTILWTAPAGPNKVPRARQIILATAIAPE